MKIFFMPWKICFEAPPLVVLLQSCRIGCVSFHKSSHVCSIRIYFFAVTLKVMLTKFHILQKMYRIAQNFDGGKV